MQKLYGPGGRFDLADPSTQTMVNQGMQNPNITPQFGVSLAEIFALKKALERISVKTQAPNQTVVDDLKNAAFAAVQAPNAMPLGQMPQQMPPQQMAQAPQGLPGLDSGVMENAQFAGGGIIAFADKGEVKGDSAFDAAVEEIFKREGDYANIPEDKGGETKYGISKRFYPNLDIKNLTKAQAKAIYKKDFWDYIGADKLPSNIRDQVFDAAVLHGRDWAKRTAMGVNYDPMALRNARFDLINNYIKKNPEQKKFREGWEKRINLAAADTGTTTDVPVGANLGLGATPESQVQYQAEVSPEDIASGGAYAGGIAGAGAAGAALRGASSSVPKPSATIPSGTNFFINPEGVAASELGARNMGTRGVPMIRPNTSLSTNVYDPVVNGAKSGTPKTLNPPLTRDAAMRAGRMLDIAGRAGRLATGPGGLGLGLGLYSSEAGAGSDVVPGREAPEGFMAGMQAAQSSERIQNILQEHDADNKAFDAAKAELSELENARKKELKTAKGFKDKSKIKKEYKPLIDAATNKRDRIRDELKQKDEKTGRLPIVERFGDLGAARQDPDSPFVVKPQVSPTVAEAVSGVPGVAEAVAAQREKYARPGYYHGEFDSTSGTDLYTRSVKDLTETKGEDEKETAKPVAIAEDSDTVTKNNVDALKAQMKQALNDRDVGYLFALAQAGFAMAASKSPYALQAVAEGAGMGVKVAQDITKDYINRDDLLKRYQREEEKEGAARRRNAKKDAETAAHNKKLLELRIKEVDEGAKIKTYEGLLVGMVKSGKMTLDEAKKALTDYYKSRKAESPADMIEKIRGGSGKTQSGAATSGVW